MAIINTFGLQDRKMWVYDSGSVAAGAVIPSAVLDLERVSELLVIVDNSAGSVFRDLTLTSYLDDGTTEIDSVVIRKVAFGAAPDGSVYVPGKVRGTIGPRAAAGPSGVHVLYDKTGAADTANDTGNLLVEGAASVEAMTVTSAGTTTLTPSRVRDDGTAQALPATAAGVNVGCAWAAGPNALYGGSGAAITSTALVAAQRRVKFVATTAGAGNTVRLTVHATGPVPGTFAAQMALPTRAKLTLAAVGDKAARMTIIGR